MSDGGFEPPITWIHVFMLIIYMKNPNQACYQATPIAHTKIITKVFKFGDSALLKSKKKQLLLSQ